MNCVKILFTKSNTLGGFAIRAALFSEHNHVGIQIGGKVYDSTFSKGVDKSSIGQFYKKWTVDYEIEFYLDDDDCKRVIKFLESQLGKKYDWRAIVALPFRRDWHKEKAWICSELVAEAMVHAGMSMPMDTNRITPRDLLFLLPAGILTIQSRNIEKMKQG